MATDESMLFSENFFTDDNWLPWWATDASCIQYIISFFSWFGPRSQRQISNGLQSCKWKSRGLIICQMVRWIKKAYITDRLFSCSYWYWNAYWQILVDGAYESVVGQRELNNSIISAFHERHSAVWKLHHRQRLACHRSCICQVLRSSNQINSSLISEELPYFSIVSGAFMYCWVSFLIYTRLSPTLLVNHSVSSIPNV